MAHCVGSCGAAICPELDEKRKCSKRRRLPQQLRQLGMLAHFCTQPCERMQDLNTEPGSAIVPAVDAFMVHRARVRLNSSALAPSLYHLTGGGGDGIGTAASGAFCVAQAPRVLASTKAISAFLIESCIWPSARTHARRKPPANVKTVCPRQQLRQLGDVGRYP